MPNNTEYIFTGYSLGGTITTLWAFDSATNNYIPVTATSPALITFDPPKLGNYAFVNKLSKVIPIIFRVANGNDIVIAIPLCVNPGGPVLLDFLILPH